jgi:hypothetical protein
MKIAEAIARVRSLYNSGTGSDDSNLSDRHIYAKLVSARTLLIKREIDKKRQVSDWIVQTINCLELEVALPNECPCAIPPGCTALKSVNKIPKPVQSAIGPELEFVTTMDGNTVYSKTNWVKKRYKSGNKYTADSPDYSIKNDYLFLIHAGKLLKYITVGGVFEDPLDIPYANGCNEGDCIDPYEVDFPIDLHIMDALIQMATQELIEVFKSIPPDDENNATQDKQVMAPPKSK